MPRFTVKYAPEALREIQHLLIIITASLKDLVAGLSKVY